MGYSDGMKMPHFPLIIIKITHFWKGNPCHNDVTPCKILTLQVYGKVCSCINSAFLESIMTLVRSTVHALILASTFTLVYNCRECTKDSINPVLSKINLGKQKSIVLSPGQHAKQCQQENKCLVPVCACIIYVYLSAGPGVYSLIHRIMAIIEDRA